MRYDLANEPCGCGAPDCPYCYPERRRGRKHWGRASWVSRRYYSDEAEYAEQARELDPDTGEEVAYDV